jgi:GT2 family glycosyltransferase
MNSRGDYIFFLDDDNVVEKEVLTELVSFMKKHDRVGVCSPVIYMLGSPGETWTTFTVKGGFPGYYKLGHYVPDVPTRTWAFHDAFMVRRSLFLQVDGFDGTNFPIHYSELDFAYRIREKGYEAVVVPSGKIWLDHGGTHMHVDSMRAFYTLRNRIILLKKHETPFKLAVYMAFMPIAVAFYLIHHARNAPDDPLAASYNLLLGVKAGLEYRKPMKASPYAVSPE